ncbi:hypothetical protein J8273_3545 [Carpediemonas membranifera]|uniref:Uncharacterized protein n=1 Tax=Carpediemonas membranifera TaxID=201153 RepID=A0A8J6B3C3_9EUKA|nr:hypothetical protein J8273_3545 [Carpediemonas membranifera]|eukprot:KAG9393409.1 hypothetical protein J8273_3545 [Carpediemonas membranifera]
MRPGAWALRGACPTRWSCLATNDMSNGDKKTRKALIAAHRLSITATSSIAGDIPSLIACAYQRHFDEQMPLLSRMLNAFRRFIRSHTTTDAPQDGQDLESLLAALSEIHLLEPSAQALLDRARSILTSGPPLSMNVELADGEELPVAMHTLNQGAVWACLVGGGANPDLEDRVLDEAREKWPDATDLHNKIRKALAPEAKCLWFLCRKFFFTLNVAEKDGERYQCSCSGYYHHHMYMGRLFMLDTTKHTALTRARMPRALEVYSDRYTHIARTPKGLWGWGYNEYSQLGFKSSGFVDPTRLTFPNCPKVAELEASLPPWEKHRMVTDALIVDKGMTKGKRTFIRTPVGTVMAGYGWFWDLLMPFVGPVEEENRDGFHPVVMPSDFIPDHIADYNGNNVILSMGDRRMISGWNFCGRLGLGHENEMTGFEEPTFRVDRIMPGCYFNVFLSGRQLLFAGQVLPHIAQSGLLPGYREDDVCLTGTPLRFPERVKGFYCQESTLVWVTEGQTHLCDSDKQYCVPFEADCLEIISARSYRHSSGKWFDVKKVSGGVAKMVKRKAFFEPLFWEITPVDVDPWAEQ